MSCATCGRSVGLCSCPPGEDEVGEGPIRRRRRATRSSDAPTPPRHPAEAEHLGARLGREDAAVPSLESLAPFADYDRRRAVEKRWELEAKAKLGLCGRGADAIPGAGAGRRFWVGGAVEFAAGGTRGRTMHDAAKAGDASAVARRLSRGEHPDQGDFLAQTCLMLAAAEGHVDVVAALFDGGAAPNARDINERTALHHAAMLNAGGGVGEEEDEGDKRAEAVERRAVITATIDALRRGGCDVNARDELGSTPLHVASERGHVTLARALLRRGADASAKDARGRTALDVSWKTQLSPLIALLSDATPKPKPFGVPDDENRRNGGKLCVKGAAKPPPYEAPFEYPPPEMKDFHASGGGGVCACGRRREKCACAARIGRRDAEKKKKDDSSASAANKGEMPRGEDATPPGYYWRGGRVFEGAGGAARGGNIHEDASRGDADAVRARVENGEAVDQRDHAMTTPLALASANGHAECVGVLLRRGAAVDAGDGGGATPLHRACLGGHLDVVELLLTHGARSGRVDDMGRNAFHHLCLGAGGNDERRKTFARALEALFRRAPPPPPPPRFARAKPSPTPPFDAPDLSGRRPRELCKDAAIVAAIVVRREENARRERTLGGPEPPHPDRIPTVLPSDWARQLRRISSGIESWPEKASAGAHALMREILEIVVETGSAPIDSGDGKKAAAGGGVSLHFHFEKDDDAKKENAASPTAAVLKRMMPAMPRRLFNRVQAACADVEAAMGVVAERRVNFADAGAERRRLRGSKDASLAVDACKACEALIDWCS